MQSTSCEMLGWMKHKLHCACQDSRFRIARRNINNISSADDITEGERGEWKSWLELQHLKNRDYSKPSVTSWQIEGEKVEAVTDFIFLGSKITADDDCSHVIERHLLLVRKAMTNINSSLRSRDITLLTKVCISKARVFQVFMYRCESWTIKMIEPQRIDAFELWCWRTLESLLDSKEIKPVDPKGN